MAEPLPTDVLELLQQRVGSLEELEVLLLLRRTRERDWEVFEIARELGLPDTIVDTTIATLRSHDFLMIEGSPAGRCRYAPRPAELAALVDRLATLYEERRLEVMRVLSAHALERVRDSAARAFAEAFVLGRKKRG
jgi:DNA-binding IclR family transcriptional regulator